METTKTTANRWGELADLLVSFNVPTFDTPRCKRGYLEIKSRVISEMFNFFSGANVAMLTAISRVMTHYATTSTDADKAEVLNQITRNGGVMEILGLMVQNWETLEAWGETLGAIADEIE